MPGLSTLLIFWNAERIFFLSKFSSLSILLLKSYNLKDILSQLYFYGKKKLLHNSFWAAIETLSQVQYKIAKCLKTSSVQSFFPRFLPDVSFRCRWIAITGHVRPGHRGHGGGTSHIQPLGVFCLKSSTAVAVAVPLRARSRKNMIGDIYVM